MDDRHERIILVDADDREIGTAPKLDGHREGLLHRALSVVIRDPAGRLLLQKRHVGKYHSGGLWTNTCCSHPRPGEPVAVAAERRLAEEMGFHCPLMPLMTVSYRAEVGNGLVEHEVVHVFGGVFAGRIAPDPSEADGFQWITAEALAADPAVMAARYSVWFNKYCDEHWGTLTADGRWAALGVPARAA